MRIIMSKNSDISFALCATLKYFVIKNSDLKDVSISVRP